ncbi:MAG: hypothetical protein RR228_03405 [Bacilli bacterium]
MDWMLDVLSKYYYVFLIIAVILVFALIGFIVESKKKQKKEESFGGAKEETASSLSEVSEAPTINSEASLEKTIPSMEAINLDADVKPLESVMPSAPQMPVEDVMTSSVVQDIPVMPLYEAPVMPTNNTYVQSMPAFSQPTQQEVNMQPTQQEVNMQPTQQEVNMQPTQQEVNTQSTQSQYNNEDTFVFDADMKPNMPAYNNEPVNSVNTNSTGYDEKIIEINENK